MKIIALNSVPSVFSPSFEVPWKIIMSSVAWFWWLLKALYVFFMSLHGMESLNSVSINSEEKALTLFLTGWLVVYDKLIMHVCLFLDCMQGPCPFGDVHLRPLGLPPLNKTFIWNVKVNRKFGLDLKFSTPWLKQIIPGDTCPDGALYKIDSRLDNSLVNIGHFCRNGTVSGVKVQGEVIMNLQLPWDSKLTTSGFKIESRSSIKSKSWLLLIYYHCSLSNPKFSMFNRDFLGFLTYLLMVILLKGVFCFPMDVEQNCQEILTGLGKLWRENSYKILVGL